MLKMTEWTECLMELLDSPLCSENLDKRSGYEQVTLWVRDRMVSEQVTALEPLGICLNWTKCRNAADRSHMIVKKNFEIGLATVEE